MRHELGELSGPEGMAREAARPVAERVKRPVTARGRFWRRGSAVRSPAPQEESGRDTVRLRIRRPAPGWQPHPVTLGVSVRPGSRP